MALIIPLVRLQVKGMVEKREKKNEKTEEHDR